MESVEAVLESETDHDGINVSIALGSAAVNVAEQTIANENTAPAGVTFGDTDTTTTGAATADDTINMVNVASSQFRSLWVRYIIDADTPAINQYDANIDVLYDSAA